LFLRKIAKIVGIRCHILKPKCTKIDFGWGSTSDHAGEAYSAPLDLIAGFKGTILLRQEKKREMGGEGNLGPHF